MQSNANHVTDEIPKHQQFAFVYSFLMTCNDLDEVMYLAGILKKETFLLLCQDKPRLKIVCLLSFF